MMLRSILPTIRRNHAHLSIRRYHPLASNWSSPAANLVPIVIEQTVSPCFTVRLLRYSLQLAQGRGERSYDIFSRLLRERVIMLYGPVGLSTATSKQTPFLRNLDTGHRLCAPGCPASLLGSWGDFQTNSSLHKLSRRECYRWTGDLWYSERHDIVISLAISWTS